MHLAVCYFCGSNLSRRTWHSSSKYSKVIWQCVKSAKKGKRFCPESKAIPEAVIEKAFVESYKILCENNQDILEDLLDKIEVILKDEKIEKEVKQIEGRITIFMTHEHTYSYFLLSAINRKEKALSRACHFFRSGACTLDLGFLFLYKYNTYIIIP